MDEVLKTNYNSSGNQDEFEDNENDSDLEGRLYAEIYFSNDIIETEENFEDNSMKTIQDIKNASRSCMPSTSQLKENPIQNSIISKDENKKTDDQLTQGLDKSLNLEKQKNSDVTFDNTPSRINNKSLNLQQKTPKSQRNKSEINKDTKNNSPILKNGQNTYDSPVKVNNTPLTTPKSAKRKSKIDKDYESARKRRSLEHNENANVESDSQLYPIQLNSRKSWAGDNLPTISNGAMDILFPKGWKEKKRIEDDEKSKIKKRKNSKSNKQNISEIKQQIEKEEIIEIISSDDSSEDFSIIDISKSEEQIVNTNKVMSILTSSDSEESIFEVPVPPKPSPPLVNVKDSDTNSSDSDDGIYDLNCMPSKKKFLSKSNDSEQSSEENTESCSNNNKTIESIDIDSEEESFSNISQSSLIENCSISSKDNYDDDDDDEPIHDLILNCVGPNSAPSLPSIEINKETRTKYSEYFKPLNDDPQPSTSKVNKIRNNRTSNEKTDEEYFFEPMLETVKAFYNNSWGGENFNIEEVRSKMSKNPKHWSILDDDWKSSSRQQRYFLNKAKCTLCRQSGHLRANCPEPKKSPICHMCGSQGHYETRCPGKICLTCGKKQHSYRKTCESCTKLVCSLCRARGHKKETCPDLWRQYHHTINHLEHKTPMNMKEVMKPSHLLICCNCTKWGHEFFNCPKYRWTPHYPTPAHVQNYSGSENAKINVEIINLEEHETSFQSNESENGENVSSTKNSNKIRNSGTLIENSNQTVKNNFSFTRMPILDNEKLIFKCETGKPRKIRLPLDQFNRIHKEQICLNNVKNANVKELIAGRISFAFLKCLSKNLKCDIYITVNADAKVFMSITYYVLFSNRHILKKIIHLWLCGLCKETRTRMKKIPNDKTAIINLLRVKFDQLNIESKSVEDCYNFLKETSMWLKENQSNSQEFKKKKKDMISMRSLLVTLLYKHDCGDEKNIFSKLESFSTIANKMGRMSFSNYIDIYYHYHLVFANHVPKTLLQMLVTYFTLNAKEVNVSMKELVFNHESDEEEIEEQESEEQEINNQVHENSSSNKLLSLSEVELTISPKNSEQKRNVFTFPTDDFIPISTINDNSIIPINQRNGKYFTNNVDNTPNDKFPSFQNVTSTSSKCSQINLTKKQRKSEDFSKSTFHSEKCNNKDRKHLRKFRKLKKEATIYMNEALQLNVPEITKTAIKVGDLINQSKLQRKHVTNLKRLCIKSQMKKLKKSSKKNSFSDF